MLVTGGGGSMLTVCKSSSRMQTNLGCTIGYDVVMGDYITLACVIKSVLAGLAVADVLAKLLQRP